MRLDVSAYSARDSISRRANGAPHLVFVQRVEARRQLRALPPPGDGVGVVIHELQVPLQPRAAVLRALAVVPVRQQHHQRALVVPLVLAARDEIIDDRLGRQLG